ncbi:hypothetical protein QFC22_001056 [Naganishia vaughanmartiniae]|uniref:Uncharacterized protein n=1 Tax=Naganishia vaughanmartiniae TaxID=1424756 RepID=A0ACC2XLX4_9TREE|nr:hypothetical protein QFC22_001056 [Naganishia vaughanmartiniae]
MSDGRSSETEAQGDPSKPTVGSSQTDMETITEDTVDLTEDPVTNQAQYVSSILASPQDHIKQLDTPKPVTRPDPAIISEFDPFASDIDTPAQASTEKSDPATPISTSSSSKPVNQSEATEPSNTSGLSRTAPSQTPNENHGAETFHAPRKAGNITQATQHSNDSPLPSRQKQNRTRSMEEADNQHRHASALISKGESRTNPKPKELAFDFQGFLAQLRTKQAEPIQKYLKSFLVSFSKRPFTVNEQIKLIHDFLSFISLKMKHIEPWRSQNTVEFDNAMEAMEKLVMNRLYTYTFTPMMDPATHPITTDDLERDAVLSQRINLFGWVREKHLDVPEGEASQGFLAFAEQGLIRHEAGSDQTSADAFLPILIFVVLRANPDNMVSNIEYINRFRSAEKLEGEPGYYLSSLSCGDGKTGAISFIETMDASGLSNITSEEFEQNMEAAIAALPPGSPVEYARGRQSNSESSVSAPLMNTAEGEEPARALTSLPANFAADTKRFFQRTGELAQDAVNRPLSALANIIDNIASGNGSEDGESEDEYPGAPGRRLRFQRDNNGNTPARSNMEQGIDSPSPSRPDNTTGTSNWFGRTAAPAADRPNDGRMQVDEMYIRSQIDLSRPPSGTATPSNDPTFNFSEITAEIDRTHATARQAGIETLHQMFPNIEEEVVGVILDSCGGELGLAIDRMLEMAAG